MHNMHCQVSGIVNQQSRTQIKNALDKIPGVHAVSVDMAEGLVHISFNAPATKDVIEDCIENTGFHLEH